MNDLTYQSSSAPVRLSGTEEVAPYSDHSPTTRTRGLAKALGWFSVGLGMTQLLAPRALGRAIGVGEHPVLFPLLGLRELGSGVAILQGSQTKLALQARVLGDVMDLALLGGALASPRSHAGRVAAATSAVLGVTALDVLCAIQLARRTGSSAQEPGAGTERVRVTKSIEVGRSARELYSVLRKLENLPRLLGHVESVREIGPTRSQWIARGPVGERFEWTAETTTEVEGELLAWQSLPGGDLISQGFIDIKPLANDCSMLVVHLEYAPAHESGDRSPAALFAPTPDHALEADLRSWKRQVEAS
jgi:uncharacterized membrane protein